MVALNEIQELSRRIAEEFQPDKIILFGSHAYGVPKEYSDVDLPVIMPLVQQSMPRVSSMMRTRPTCSPRYRAASTSCCGRSRPTAKALAELHYRRSRARLVSLCK